MSKLRKFLKPNMKVYLSIEKRINFALAVDGQSFCSYARAYDHLMVHLYTNTDTLDPWTQTIIPKSNFTVKKLETNFSKYFEYDRVPELELFEITINELT